jgi:hypothetical protein
VRQRRDHAPACDHENVSPTRRQQDRAAAIAAEIAGLAFALPGTLIERPMRCGRARCRCHADPPQLHGPYHQWTRKVDGRTVTRFLSDDQLEDYQPWFDNHRRLRALVASSRPSARPSPTPTPAGTAGPPPPAAKTGKPPRNTVDAPPLTRGHARHQQPLPQVTAKCEDLTRLTCADA